MDLRITVDGKACTIVGLVLIFVVFWQVRLLTPTPSSAHGLPWS